jgi:hypothetical protein
MLGDELKRKAKPHHPNTRNQSRKNIEERERTRKERREEREKETDAYIDDEELSSE